VHAMGTRQDYRQDYLHPGEDKVARVATIKTANGEIKRAIKLLCPLPMEQ